MNGIKRGLQLIVDMLRMIVKAAEKGNQEALHDALGVVKQWLRETADIAGVVKVNPATLLFGSDPWQDSRKMEQAFAAKWQGKL